MTLVLVGGPAVLVEAASARSGWTAYVTNAISDSVTPVDTATNSAGAAIAVGATPGEVAITPDGKTAYVANFHGDTVTPIDTATNTAGAAIPVGSSPHGVAITPDQAPAAAFATNAGAAGQPSRFDAALSASPVGSIASYQWDFGEGQTAATTTPTPTHVYASPGAYTARLTVTNSAGTSTAQVFTGQTVSNQGGPQASTTHTATVTPPPITAPPITPPPSTPARITGLRVAPNTFSLAGRKINGKCVRRTAKNNSKPRCRRPVMLTVSWTQGSAATVTITLERVVTGRQVGGRCLAPSKNDRHQRCRRLVAIPGSYVKKYCRGDQ